MRLVTLSTNLRGRKVVIDADKILHIIDWTETTEPAKPATVRTAIQFQGDGNPDGGLVVNQSVDEVVSRIRAAISLNERI